MHPNDDDLYNNLGDALFFTGDTKGAIQNYRKAIEINPNSS